MRDHETGNASQNVAERIKDRIAVVAECRSLFAIALDYEFRVFKYFPGSFQKSRQRQSPGCCYSREGQCQHPTEREAVKDMCKRVWIEEVLGVMRAPDVAGPGEELMTCTPPGASLVAELQDGEGQNCDDKDRWREPGSSRLEISGFDQLDYV